LVIGLGMSAGLYDASFSTLGRLYGSDARQAIATLTLFGGFASTACWPLSAYLVSAFGWRGACFGYAALHLLVVLPLYLVILPHRPAPASTAQVRRHARSSESPGAGSLFILLAAVVTIAS